MLGNHLKSVSDPAPAGLWLAAAEALPPADQLRLGTDVAWPPLLPPVRSRQ